MREFQLRNLLNQRVNGGRLEVCELNSLGFDVSKIQRGFVGNNKTTVESPNYHSPRFPVRLLSLSAIPPGVAKNGV